MTLQIGEVIRNAVVFDVKNRAGDAMSTDSLIQSVQDFFALLEERRIDYVLAGGVALLHYVPGRNTQDLDLIMAAASLKRLPELTIISKDKNFARARYGDLQIDILLTSNPLFKKVHRERTRVEEVYGRSIPLATVDGLILLKLYALPSLYRQGNFARVGLYENDIATLIHYYRPDTDALLAELAQYVDAADAAEIANIMADIRQRLARFDDGSR